MNILKISTASFCDGLGVRVVLWVAGCSHHCEGCHNQCSWDFNQGKIFDKNDKNLLLKLLAKPYIKGLTFSGGDPLNPKNIQDVTELAKIVKSEFPNKDIWCYTGYSYEEVKDLPIMSFIDVLVDGKFEKDKRDITLPFRGSSNQNIIYLK